MNIYNISQIFLYIIMLIEFIFQTTNLVLFFKKLDDKYFHRFISFSFIFFAISYIALIYHLKLYGEHLSQFEGIEIFLVLACYIVPSFISLITGIIIRIIKLKNGMTKKHIFTDKKFISLITVIVLLSNYFIAIPLPRMAGNHLKNTQSKIAIEYLTNKYGNLNFKVENSYNDIEYNGFSKYLGGTTLEISSDVTKNTFNMDFSNPNNNKIIHDYFLVSYYNEHSEIYNSDKIKENNFSDFLIKDIKNNYPDITVWDNEEYKKSNIYKLRDVYDILTNVNNGSYKENNLIPADYGKIPAIDEIEKMLYEYITVKNGEILKNK